MNKIEAGFFSFTEILDGEHRSYNEWHQLDHMVEQFPLRGIAHGERWVSSPACRDARIVSHPDLDAAHYITLYLMTHPLAETLIEFRDLGARLAALGRFHRHRRTHLVGPHLFVSAQAAPRTVVSAESLPWYPGRGIFVEVHQPTDPDVVDGWCDWRERQRIPELIATPGVLGAWTFVDRAIDMREPSPVRRITVVYLDDDPSSVAARIAADYPDDPPGVETWFAGPLEKIVPHEWAWFD